MMGEVADWGKRARKFEIFNRKELRERREGSGDFGWSVRHFLARFGFCPAALGSLMALKSCGHNRFAKSKLSTINRIQVVKTSSVA